MENAWLGRKLLLAAQQGVADCIIDNTNVIAVEQQPDGVTLGFSYYGEEEHEQQLQASLLVACDGRDSTVRQLLDIGTTTYDYQQTAIVGVVETDKPHDHVAIERFSPAGPLAVLPLTDQKAMAMRISTRLRTLGGWVCPKAKRQDT